MVALVKSVSGCQIALEQHVVDTQGQRLELLDIAAEKKGALAVENVEIALKGQLGPGIVERDFGVVPVTQRFGHLQGGLALIVVGLELSQRQRSIRQQ